MSLFLAHISSVCAVKKNFSKLFCCFSVCCFKEGSRENASKCVEKRGKTNERKILNSLFIFRYKRTLLAITTRYKKEYRVLFTATRGTERERERERCGNHREGESQLSSRRKKYRRHFLTKDITIERRSGKSTTTTKRTNKEFERKTHR